MDWLKAFDRPVAFHPVFVEITGSVTAALMLSQAVYWSRRTPDPTGWFYKSREQWQAETGLTRREQEGARQKLKDTGFWEEELRGVPATMHYRIDIGKLESSLHANCQPVGTKAPNWIGENLPTLNTSSEITSENTTGARAGGGEERQMPPTPKHSRTVASRSPRQASSRKQAKPPDPAPLKTYTLTEGWRPHESAVDAVVKELGLQIPRQALRFIADKYIESRTGEGAKTITLEPQKDYERFLQHWIKNHQMEKHYTPFEINDPYVPDNRWVPPEWNWSMSDEDRRWFARVYWGDEKLAA